MSKQATLTLLALSVFASPAAAHFPWLGTDDKGHAVLFFGESPAERDYHLPEAVEKAEVALVGGDASTSMLALPQVDEDDFIGRRSAEAVASKGRLESTIVYGVYHGTKLTYYAQHALEVGDTPAKAPEKPSPLRAEVTSADDGGVKVRLLWEEKPLKDAEVKLFCEEGHEEGAAATDAKGEVAFDGKQVEPGLNGILVGHVVENSSGKIDDKQYASESHYLTLTFHKPAATEEGAAEAEPKEEDSAGLPKLPKAVASFGAAVCDGWLYVYSGHTGKAHDHSRENLSQHFCRLKLEGGQEWERLPIEAPLQGLPLVAHGGMLYRVGGLSARNASGEDEDLHSINDFARFDPAAKKWESLPPLPEPRSSHDAVVIGDKLYVAGGWTLSGSSEGDWLDTAWVCDLKDASAGWSAIASPPFRRRALAAGHLEGKLIIIGGMDEEQDISNHVDCFDPATGDWSQLADLPGEYMSGFGVSAWRHGAAQQGGGLYVSGMEGVLYRLGSTTGEWQKAGTLEEPRFFHRLVSADEKRLLAVAGASPDMEVGHLDNVETLTTN